MNTEEKVGKVNTEGKLNTEEDAAAFMRQHEKLLRRVHDITNALHKLEHPHENYIFVPNGMLIQFWQRGEYQGQQVPVVEVYSRSYRDATTSNETPTTATLFVVFPQEYLWRKGFLEVHIQREREFRLGALEAERDKFDRLIAERKGRPSE